MDLQENVVFSGRMFTYYGQMYIVSGDYEAGLASHASFIGQTNGICGGAVPGGLYLRVGVHTGEVCITVEIHEHVPLVDDAWEEIVEVSCNFNSLPISLQSWAGESSLSLPLLAGSYRARLCANGFAQSETIDIFGDPSVESYCLILWPEKRRPDEVLKQTSDIAIFRNQQARKSSAYF